MIAPRISLFEQIQNSFNRDYCESQSEAEGSMPGPSYGQNKTESTSVLAPDVNLDPV